MRLEASECEHCHHRKITEYISVALLLPVKDTTEDSHLWAIMLHLPREAIYKLPVFVPLLYRSLRNGCFLFKSPSLWELVTTVSIDGQGKPWKRTVMGGDKESKKMSPRCLWEVWPITYNPLRSSKCQSEAIAEIWRSEGDGGGS